MCIQHSKNGIINGSSLQGKRKQTLLCLLGTNIGSQQRAIGQIHLNKSQYVVYNLNLDITIQGFNTFVALGQNEMVKNVWVRRIPETIPFLQPVRRITMTRLEFGHVLFKFPGENLDLHFLGLAALATIKHIFFLTNISTESERTVTPQGLTAPQRDQYAAY